MDISEMFAKWTEIEKTFNSIPNDSVRAMLCMTIDFVANKIGEKSVDMLQELIPIIGMVNEAFPL